MTFLRWKAGNLGHRYGCVPLILSPSSTSAGVRNCLSLSERGGTTSYCRAGRRRHHISLRVARRLFNWSSCCPILRVRAHLSAFESTCASERALGDCAHARDVVLARASITCVARVLSLCVYVRMYVSVCNCVLICPVS